ncbi:NAD(P)-binding protein [Gymnopus androsaceus JB14]|uniref:NAD(P)-binding protein n=1 Tax=Gymnopus androsaceus JB14 TaxID=1447944 RepID=A0A6A4HXW5_9AGAR|nr:NAD(P)-binding protein [Gymnopus androsaceus JB14]
MSAKPVVIIAGIGVGGGTGGATARAFSKEGYSIALIARGSDSLKALEDELRASGADAASFLIPPFEAVRTRFPSPEYIVRAALYNAVDRVWKPFFEVTDEDMAGALQTQIEGAWYFSREAISEFKKNDIEPISGKRGILMFTGATASLRGNTSTSIFSAGKHAQRGLSQSLAKEFGKDNIHVAHVIIDGAILTPFLLSSRNDPTLQTNEDIRLSPQGIASTLLFLTKQHRSTWTWELDLRPAHEKW